MLYNSGPQPFWHQEPVSWKRVFPRMGVGWGAGNGSGGDASEGERRGAMGSDGERGGAADEAPLARALLASCCAAQLLTGPVAVRSPGVGDP